MEMDNNYCVRDLIIRGSQDPGAPAIESPGYLPLTYRAMREQIITTVQSLNARGLRSNDRVAVVMPNSPHAAVATMAVMAGFTVIPLNPQFRAAEYSYFFSTLGIKAVLIEQLFVTAILNDLALVEHEDLAGVANRG